MLSERTVNPEMVTLARELRGLTQSSLSRAAAISQGHLSKIEAGLWPVPESALLKLSEVLELPANFFFQKEPRFGPGVSEFFHRKRQDVSATALRQAYARINLFLIHLSRLLKLVDIGDWDIPRFDRLDYKSVDEAARALRAKWQLPVGPIVDMVRVIEQAGGIIVRCSFGTPRIDAISRWAPGLPPVFFVNEEIPSDRERLTLAHELGHLVLHEAPIPEMEEEANRFAAEFLMPEREIKAHFDKVNLSRLATLKPYWKVSMGALLYRATDLGRVSENAARYLWSQMSSAGYKRREPPELDVPKEQPTLLEGIFRVLIEDFDYTTVQLAEFLCLYDRQVSDMYGIRPRDDGRPRIRLVK